MSESSRQVSRMPDALERIQRSYDRNTDGGTSVVRLGIEMAT